jgi:16S rRNA (cytidine1402-2'-O)-methyltransferase
MSGRILLIPNTIGNTNIAEVLPPDLKSIVLRLKFFIVEDIRNARRFLKLLNKEIVIDDIEFFVLNKHTDKNIVEEFILPAFKGHDIGLISEAGLPCIADPGNIIVELGHKFNMKIVPLSGPSSIIMALIASGLNGQNFAFNGYLPVNKHERLEKIKSIESRSLKEKQTQIFMETPYRNNQLMEDVLKTCRNNTLLCIASNISLKNEFIKTMTIGEWKNYKKDLNKQPAVFLVQAV